MCTPASGLGQITAIVDENFDYQGALNSAQAAINQAINTGNVSDWITAYNQLNTLCTTIQNFNVPEFESMVGSAQTLMTDIGNQTVNFVSPYQSAYLQLQSGETPLTISQLLNNSTGTYNLSQTVNPNDMNSTSWFILHMNGTEATYSLGSGVTSNFSSSYDPSSCSNNTTLSATATGAAAEEYGAIQSSINPDDINAILDA